MFQTASVLRCLTMDETSVIHFSIKTNNSFQGENHIHKCKRKFIGHIKKRKNKPRPVCVMKLKKFHLIRQDKNAPVYRYSKNFESTPVVSFTVIKQYSGILYSI